MPASRQHNAKLHHLAEHAIAKDIRANTIKVARVSVLTPEEQEAVEEDRRISLGLSRFSLRVSRGWRENVLGVACLAHDAHRGEWCWRNPRSGVRGLCPERIARAEREDHGFQMSASKIGSGR